MDTSMREGELSMLRRLTAAAVTTLAVLSSPAFASDYCPDRPGINTPPCVMADGKLAVEIALVDWTHDHSAGNIDDTVLAGDTELRYGIGGNTELRLGWTAYGHDRQLNTGNGRADNSDGIGDVVVGIKKNLLSPDGSKFSAGLVPYATLPAGGKAIGAGDWGAGLLVPLSLQVSDTVTLMLTPELDAAVDQDRSGRHIAYGTAGGVQLNAATNLSLSFEAQMLRDQDPMGHKSETLAGASAGYKVGEDTQVDIGAQFGVDANAPDVELSFGIARRF